MDSDIRTDTIKDHIKALTRVGHLVRHGAGRLTWYGCVLPERWLTLYSEDIGNTISLCGRTMCLGRSVIKWKSVFGLLPVYSMVRS